MIETGTSQEVQQRTEQLFLHILTVVSPERLIPTFVPPAVPVSMSLSMLDCFRLLLSSMASVSDAPCQSERLRPSVRVFSDGLSVCGTVSECPRPSFPTAELRSDCLCTLKNSGELVDGANVGQELPLVSGLLVRPTWSPEVKAAFKIPG